eukprot:g5845.t1
MSPPPVTLDQLDGDTAVSAESGEAALRAAGAVCHGVDRVLAGDCRNAFCAVRPPGHHAGPWGVTTNPNDPHGSHGFCLLNNVAIGAAYARCVYRHAGVRKVAIIDFDVHHGNGTEALVRNLRPSTHSETFSSPFGETTAETPMYKPWLDEKTDTDEVFFASIHGYGKKVPDAEARAHTPWFYPASGATTAAVEADEKAAAAGKPAEDPDGYATDEEEVKVYNVGMTLPLDGKPRPKDWRNHWRDSILPALWRFGPDLLFISAGFDAHKKDELNMGYLGISEPDYEWLTRELVKVANTCCDGRLVSCLEGGYRIQGRVVSAFGRSVAAHVRALAEPGVVAYDPKDVDYLRAKEREREAARRAKREQQRKERAAAAEAAAAEATAAAAAAAAGVVAEGGAAAAAAAEGSASGEPAAKRRRGNVDYVALNAKLEAEKGKGQ